MITIPLLLAQMAPGIIAIALSLGGWLAAKHAHEKARDRARF